MPGEFEKSFIPTVRPTINTNPSQKRSFLKTLFKSEKFENAGFMFVWTENILKTELFENDGLGIIMQFS